MENEVFIIQDGNRFCWALTPLHRAWSYSEGFFYSFNDAVRDFFEFVKQNNIQNYIIRNS